jgi:hypothetical protein
MFRNSATRTFRALHTKPTSTIRPLSTSSVLKSQLRVRSNASTSSAILALSIRRPASNALVRFASTVAANPYDKINAKAENKIGSKELEKNPEEVSVGSSVRHVLHEEGVEAPERDVDMLAGVKSDLVSHTNLFV